jgi:hypothetical protein
VTRSVATDILANGTMAKKPNAQYTHREGGGGGVHTRARCVSTRRNKQVANKKDERRTKNESHFLLLLCLPRVPTSQQVHP